MTWLAWTLLTLGWVVLSASTALLVGAVIAAAETLDRPLPPPAGEVLR